MPDKQHLLLVDDSEMDREEVRAILGGRYALDEAPTGEAGWDMLLAGRYDAILLDLDLGPGMDGFQFLERMRKEGLWVPVLVVSKTGSIGNVVRAMKLGASNFIGKQAGGAEMELALQKALAEVQLARDNSLYREQIDAAAGSLIVGSDASRQLLEELKRLAPTDATVLIAGETGTGKEVVAREIHRRSRRSDRPLLVLDCTTIRDSLAESILFGHEKGSFSGAARLQQGRFEVADGGTIFLDEIGELPLDLQPKFLRILESGTLYRLGGHKEISVDVRVIAATHRDLSAEVEAGRFRADLFYRLAVATLTVPPLRERRQDVPNFVQTFLAQLNAGRGTDSVRVRSDALMALAQYTWPGNVRELKNAVERCFLFADGGVIDKHTVARTLPIDSLELPDYKEAKQRHLDLFEREYITAALRITSGNVSKAAELIGVSRFGLQKALERLEIDAGRSKPAADAEGAS